MVISNDDVVLPDLSPTAVIDGTPFTVTVNTNAAQGATVGVTSSKAGLGGTAATDNHLIGFATPTATAEGYNLTVDGATSTAGAVPSIPTATIAVATSVGILSTTGPTAGAQVTVTPHASISAITPADTYSVAHTFTVTGTY